MFRSIPRSTPRRRRSLQCAFALSGSYVFTQVNVTDPAAAGNLPNPNPTVIKNWGVLPDGRVWGNTAGVDIGPDGHVWAYDRCGTNSCLVDGKISTDEPGLQVRSQHRTGARAVWRRPDRLPARHPRRS